MQPDSLIPDPTNPQAWNRYGYVLNNPIRYKDPSGHCYANSGVWIPNGAGGNCLFNTTPPTTPDPVENGGGEEGDNDRKNPIDLLTSEQGKNFIKDWEKLIPYLYDNDGGGNCTIGYGHLLHEGRCDLNGHLEASYLFGISEEQALILFATDVSIAEQTIRKYVTSPLYQHEFDALVSFTYTVGEGVGEYGTPGSRPGLSNSNILDEVNAGNFGAVPDRLSQWIYPLEATGLITRRYQEGIMFSQGIYDSTH